MSTVDLVLSFSEKIAEIVYYGRLFLVLIGFIILVAIVLEAMQSGKITGKMILKLIVFAVIIYFNFDIFLNATLVSY